MVTKEELQEARETPESECFDCMDYARIGRCCPAHAIIRKENLPNPKDSFITI